MYGSLNPDFLCFIAYLAFALLLLAMWSERKR
jgi:hypothetical protein